MAIPNHEQRLLERAATFSDVGEWDELSSGELCQLTRLHGIDFATAVLLDRLRRSNRHGPLINRIDKLRQVNVEDLCCAEYKLVVLPGAFHREYPQTGADGEALLKAGTSLGIETTRLPLSSHATRSINGRMILDWLDQQPPTPVVLVSLSKGGADLATALRIPGAASAMQHVRAWIDIGGTPFGAAGVSWLMDRRFRRVLLRLFFAIRRLDFGFMHDMQRRPPPPAPSQFQLPTDLETIHVCGFPLQAHLSGPLARKWHRRLMPLGPNDSLVILSDLLACPGFCYPIWGTDHYLQPGWRTISVIAALLHNLGQDETARRPIQRSDGKITAPLHHRPSQ